MARRTVVDCDGCRKEDIAGLSVVFNIGYQGVGEDEKTDELDLCLECFQTNRASREKLQKQLRKADKHDFNHGHFLYLWNKINNEVSLQPQS